MEWIKKNKVLVIVLAAVVLLGLIILIVISSIFSVRNEGERYEQRLTFLYGQSVNALSTCIDQGRTAAQVTQEEYDTIKETLVEVAAARYVDSEGNATDASGVLGGGQLISALQENYPQIDQRSWQNLQTLVIGCRDEFQGTQDRVLDQARYFNEWRVSDDVFNSWIKAEFPSDELKVVTSNGETLYAMSAYDRITRVVAVDDANEAFETGELGEQDLFADN
ncbi:MAG: hypothetical protein JWO54_450 [Candidatus Saccharibacteria bacterium]|nr:hypothetical protein [Candidatus Saccharibacteria bacterium]MDB5180690.1 hypothetical protein [Candidatus Saccharibacteria bacterium]